ncbi:hypothetical protein B0F90DRAFT_1924710 [Multifurca ochricompacta]|uniref:Uncharacterized protein n=1 Tax=Multifurca ochricompacta TaxID=376703 RepID=A0AAD4M6X2_9AGAM|nr:hypothetical protein B0F90DRAFT_1924710 [Multifurca ochricompacta]
MSRSRLPSSSSANGQPSLDTLNAESLKLRSQITSEIDEADDPLELYDRFVMWIFDKYPREHLASSGLIELLEEATRRYKDDSSYKSDLRVVYKFILTNGIGTVYALLFEDYALTLERDGRYSAADEVYRAGIQRKARPVDRLKKRYDEFRRRTSSKPPMPPPAAPVALPKAKGTSEADLLRRQPLRNYDNPTSVTAQAQPKPTSTPSQDPSPPSLSSASYSHNRYFHMLAPPLAGKRPEKLRLHLNLLFTEEGGEYSMPEARARSMGLLGKKWGQPPASELPRENPSTTRVNFNDDGSRNTRSYTARRSLAGGEPTVTINTKAALADVFGMYNSPEKSTRFSTMPGTKHAPVRAVEPVTPLSLLLQTRPASVEKPNSSAAVIPSFTPFVDENAGRRKENAAPPKFKPFVDATLQARTPTSAPAPAPGRRALASKDIGAATSVPPPKGSGGAALNVFSKVFTPVTKEEIRQSTGQSPQSEGQVFQAVGENGPPQLNSQKLTLLGDVQPPFKVFSRPPEKKSVFSKPGSFPPPFVDDPSTAPPRPALCSRPPLGVFVPQRTEEEALEVLSDDEDEEDHDGRDAQPNPTMDYEEDLEDFESAQNAPFGGRFGQFNVMTPIAERTLEYTSTGRFSVTDSDISALGERPFGQPDAVEAAEKLAAEVRRDNVFMSEQQVVNSRPILHSGDDETSSVSSEESMSSRPPPFRLSDGHTIPSLNKEKKDLELQAVTTLVEEKTGTLNLSDDNGSRTLSYTSRCSAPGRLAEIRSQTDEGHGMSSRSLNHGQIFPLQLGDMHFDVYEKLDDDENEESRRVAIKVVKPQNEWEFRMLRKVHASLPARLRSSVIHPQALYTFRDESFLVLDLCTQGSLLDIINGAGPAGVSQPGACLDELLVTFFTVELLRLLEGLHSKGIIHGDLKIDNCLVRLEDVPGGASAWAAQYDPAGAGGWRNKGIKLIDFGRAIDTPMFPRGQTFIAEWATDARDCVEMREGQPWTYQADYFGLAGIVYCMLYGKYIEASSIVRVKPQQIGEQQHNEPRYKLTTPFKRYWQTDLWTRLFDVLLNPSLVHPNSALPVSEILILLRAEMEAWLQANCNRSSNTLKGLLKKVELSVIRGE